MLGARARSLATVGATPDRHSELAAAHVGQLGGVVADHVHGVVNPVVGANLRHRAHAAQGRTYSKPHNGCLGDGRLPNPRLAELAHQAQGHAKAASGYAYALSEVENTLIAAHLLAEGLVDGLDVGYLTHPSTVSLCEGGENLNPR